MQTAARNTSQKIPGLCFDLTQIDGVVGLASRIQKEKSNLGLRVEHVYDYSLLWSERTLPVTQPGVITAKIEEGHATTDWALDDSPQ